MTIRDSKDRLDLIARYSKTKARTETRRLSSSCFGERGRGEEVKYKKEGKVDAVHNAVHAVDTRASPGFLLRSARLAASSELLQARSATRRRFTMMVGRLGVGVGGSVSRTATDALTAKRRRARTSGVEG